MAKIIDGKAISAQIRAEIKEQTEAFAAENGFLLFRRVAKLCEAVWIKI